MGNAGGNAGAETLVRVGWTPRALSEVDAIRNYIAEQGAPIAAARMAERIVEAGEGLAHHPERGRPFRGQVRELTTVRPYIIRYRLRTGLVEILRVKHAAQRR